MSLYWCLQGKGFSEHLIAKIQEMTRVWKWLSAYADWKLHARKLQLRPRKALWCVLGTLTEGHGRMDLLLLINNTIYKNTFSAYTNVHLFVYKIDLLPKTNGFHSVLIPRLENMSPDWLIGLTTATLSQWRALCFCHEFDDNWNKMKRLYIIRSEITFLAMKNT